MLDKTSYVVRRRQIVVTIGMQRVKEQGMKFEIHYKFPGNFITNYLFIIILTTSVHVAVNRLNNKYSVLSQ